MYESHYGFSAKPFQLSPDPRFFFASKKHKQAMSYLEYGLDQGEGFIVITGPIGTGKTTLAQSLLNNISNSNIKAVQIVTSNLAPDDLLALIAKEFGLSPVSRTKSYLLEIIEQHLKFLNTKNKRALLIVDEAQNLPIDTVEELRMLSNFHNNNKPLLQSFLLGQEELKTNLQNPAMEQFRQRIIASCHLSPLSTDEVEQYIVHRLTLVGCTKSHFFDAECYELIQNVTKGIPRKINLLIDRILLFGFLNDLDSFTFENVQLVVNEMEQELNISTPDIGAELTTPTQQRSAQPANYLSNSHNISKTLEKIEEFLKDSLEPKVKMNRYLDKLIKQKNLAVTEAKRVQKTK